jgi:hypothetical protein
VAPIDGLPPVMAGTLPAPISPDNGTAFGDMTMFFPLFATFLFAFHVASGNVTCAGGNTAPTSEPKGTT